MSNELLLSLPDEENSIAAAPATATEAHAYAARGDWAGAERLFEEARVAAARAGDDVALAVALTNRGQALARLGRLEEAALILDAALETRRRLHAAGAAGEGVVARGLADVAAVAAALGEPTEAARLLRRARAHAVSGGARELITAIDERLAGARALGAADDDVAAPAAPEAPDLAESAEPSTGFGELALETFGADEPDADDAAGGPALTFLDADPLAESAPLAEATPALELESLVDAGPAIDAAPSLGVDLLMEPTPVLDEEPVVDLGASLDLGTALPAGVELLVDAPESGAPSTRLDVAALADEALGEPMPVDATVPVEWLAPTPDEPMADAEALDVDADTEGVAEDAWSQVDPAPFDSLDADDVHSRAVALDTSPRGYPAITVEPDDLASADALLSVDEDTEPTSEPAGEPAPVATVPTPGASQARRRTTGGSPSIAPPEPKRSWWRRLTGARG